MDGQLLDAGEGMSRGVAYSYVVSSTGPNKGTYEWWLGRFFDSEARYLETEDFMLGQYNWRLRLFPKVTQSGIDYIAVGLVSLNQEEVRADLVVTAINRSNPQNSTNSGDRFTFQNNQDRGFTCFQELRTLMDPTAGFFRDGRYVLEATIAVVPSEPSSEALHQRSLPGESTRNVTVFVLSDNHLRKQSYQTQSFVLPAVHPFMFSVPETKELSAFVTEVSRASGISMDSMRMWLCGRSADGTPCIQRPLVFGSGLIDEPIAHFCENRGKASRALTLFLESAPPGVGLPTIHRDSWILFCKLMDPQNDFASYMRSIVIQKSLLVSDLKKTAVELPRVNEPEGSSLATQLDVLIQTDDLRPTKIDPSSTIEHCGLWNGAVFLLCRKERSGVVIDKMHRWLQLDSLLWHAVSQERRSGQSPQQGGPSSRRPSHVHHSSLLGLSLKQTVDEAVAGVVGMPRAQDDEELCVICLDKPRVSGFLHEDNEAHICACYECAQAVMERTDARCPLCNQAVVHLIKRIR